MPRLSASSQHRIRFTLNGRLVSGFAEPRMLLSDFIRHVIGATGTHVGCEHGVCGACTVQIDGVPARSCGGVGSARAPVEADSDNKVITSKRLRIVFPYSDGRF